jgi:uncharacterized protein YeaO (DUF488 family)
MVDNSVIGVRRHYDEPHSDDGTRVLVDRRWPRRTRKTRARLNKWCPILAAPWELRTWYPVGSRLRRRGW